MEKWNITDGHRFIWPQCGIQLKSRVYQYGSDESGGWESIGNRETKKGLILHSDQGSQYTSWEFVDYCKKRGIRQRWVKPGALMIMRLWNAFTIHSKMSRSILTVFPVRKVWMKQSGNMCTYGITISVPIRIIVGRLHLKQDIHSEFFERIVTKKLDHYIEKYKTDLFLHLRIEWKNKSVYSGIADKKKND